MPAHKSSGASRNDARRCGKKWKQRPGVSPKSHPGRTVSGYSPAKLALRARKRGA